MPEIKRKPRPKKKKMSKKVRPFFNFKRNKFSRKAVAYHNEVVNLTNNLITINHKVSRRLALCKRHIEIIGKENFFLSQKDLNDFRNLLYHIENYSFRVGAYKDKMCYFINYALDIGYGDSEMGMQNKLIRNGVIKKAKIDVILKRFITNQAFKEGISRRKRMAHRIYYNQKDTGYHPLMISSQDSEDDDKKKFTKEWRKNIIKEAKSIEKCTSEIIKINDLVMNKINKYKFKK